MHYSIAPNIDPIVYVTKGILFHIKYISINLIDHI